VAEPVTAGIAGAASLGSALIGSSASRSAARTQANAARDAAASQQAMFERQVELQEPFRQAGLTAQNRLMELLGLGGTATAPGYGRFARDFGMADFTADPGYGFRMSEGTKALERSAAARGGLLSGATLRGVQRFGQDLASQEYQNAFNRYQVNRAGQLNPLQSLMGAGQTGANVLTGAAGEAGRGIGATQMAAGQARASGYVGGANALTGALQSGLQGYLQYNALRPGGFGGFGAFGGMGSSDINQMLTSQFNTGGTV
jgi:hypothetical protein